MALPSWDQAQQNPKYINATPEQQAQMRDNYVKAGGTIPADAAPTSTPQNNKPDDWASKTAAFLGSAGQATGESIGREIQRVGHGIQEIGTPLINTLTGNEQYNNVDQAGLEQAEQTGKSEYAKRMDSLSSQSGRKVGEFIGSTAAGIAEYSNPWTAGLAGTAGAYADQSPENKSLLRAGEVGATTAATAKFFPKVGGTGWTGAAKKVATGVGVGAVGATAIGAASENSQTGGEASAEDMLAAGLREAPSGALFGGLFTGAHMAGEKVLGRGAADKTASATTIPDSATPQARESIQNQADAISSAATPQDKAAAYGASSTHNFSRGLKIGEENGVKFTNDAVYDNPEAQQLTGITQEQAALEREGGRREQSDISPLRGPKAVEGKATTDIVRNRKNAQNFLDNLNDTTQRNLGKLDDVILAESRAGKDLPPEERLTGADVEPEMRPLTDFRNAYKKFYSKFGNAEVRSGQTHENMLRDAAELENMYHELPPEDQAVVDQFSSPKGMTEGFEPAAHFTEVNEFGRAMDNMDEHWRFGRGKEEAGKEAPLPMSKMGLAKNVLKRWKAGSVRKARVEQQERLSGLTRDLATSDLAVSKARRQMENAQASMEVPAEDPIPFEPTPERAPEPTVEAPVTPRDTTEARRLAQAQLQAEARRRAAQAQSEAQAQPTPEPVAEPTGPDVAGLSSAARNEAAVAQHRADLERARREAEASAQAEPEATKPSPDQNIVRTPTRPESRPEGTPATWKNKDFDMPIEHVSDEATGYSKVRPAILDSNGQITGYGKDTFVPTHEIVHPEGSAKAPKVEEPSTATPQPDQALVREPTRRQTEPTVEEQAAEPEEAPAPKSEPLPTKTPKSAKDVKPLEPEKEVPDYSKASTPKQYRSLIRRLNQIRDYFFSPEVKTKLTDEYVDTHPLGRKAAIRDIVAEDQIASGDEIRKSVDLKLQKKAVREGYENELNRRDLTKWAEDNEIPSEYVEDAIRIAGKDTSNILSTQPLKERAMKLMREAQDLAAKERAAKIQEKWDRENPQAVETYETQSKELTENLNDLLKSEKGLSPERAKAVRDLMEDHIEKVFRSTKANAAAKSRKAGTEIPAEPLAEGEFKRELTQFFNEYERRVKEQQKAAKVSEDEIKAADTARRQKIDDYLNVRAERNVKAKATAENTKAIAEQRTTFDDLLKTLPESIREEQTNRVNDLLETYHNGKLPQPMPANEARGLLNSLKNKRNDAIERMSREEQKAQEAKQKEWDKVSEDFRKQFEEARASAKTQKDQMESRRLDMEELTGQTGEIRMKMEAAMKEAHPDISQDLVDKFTGSYLDENFGKLTSPMSDTKLNGERALAIKQARTKAEAMAKAKSTEEAEDIARAEQLQRLNNENQKIRTANAEYEKANAELTEKLTTQQALFEKLKANSDMEGVKEGLDEGQKKQLSGIIGEIEKAMNNSSDLSKIADHLDALSKLRGRSEGSSPFENTRRYADAVREVAQYKNNPVFAKHPEAWMSENTYSNISEEGITHAGGNKTKLLQKVFPDVKSSLSKNQLLSQGEVDKVRKIITRYGESNPKIFPNFRNVSYADYRGFLDHFNEDGSAKAGSLRSLNLRRSGMGQASQGARPTKKLKVRTKRPE